MLNIHTINIISISSRNSR